MKRLLFLFFVLLSFTAIGQTPGTKLTTWNQKGRTQNSVATPEQLRLDSILVANGMALPVVGSTGGGGGYVTDTQLYNVLDSLNDVIDGILNTNFTNTIDAIVGFKNDVVAMLDSNNFNFKIGIDTVAVGAPLWTSPQGVFVFMVTDTNFVYNQMWQVNGTPSVFTALQGFSPYERMFLQNINNSTYSTIVSFGDYHVSFIRQAMRNFPGTRKGFNALMSTPVYIWYLYE